MFCRITMDMSMFVTKRTFRIFTILITERNLILDSSKFSKSMIKSYMSKPLLNIRFSSENIIYQGGDIFLLKEYPHKGLEGLKNHHIKV